MLHETHIKELLLKDKRFQNFNKEDQIFIIDMVQGKTEEFIVAQYDHNEVIKEYERASGGTR